MSSLLNHQNYKRKLQTSDLDLILRKPDGCGRQHPAETPTLYQGGQPDVFESGEEQGQGRDCRCAGRGHEKTTLYRAHRGEDQWHCSDLQHVSIRKKQRFFPEAYDFGGERQQTKHGSF